MAPTTSQRLTKARSGDTREPGIKANAKINQGSLVAIGADGLAVPMATATTLRGAGRAEHDADNTGGADGAIRIKIGAGIYAFGNSAAADAIGRKDIGKLCYGVDDQTVALTDGTTTRSIAGTIFDVDADGVWVDFR
jgi:hypothetical protein